jgi:hypothetical protein
LGVLLDSLEGNTEFPVRVEFDKDEELTAAEHLVLFTQMRQSGYKIWTTLGQNKWTVDFLEITKL